MSYATVIPKLEAKFRSLPQSMLSELRGLGPIVEPHIDRIMRAVYDSHGTPDGGAADTARRRFQRMFSGQFDRGYIDLVRQVQEMNAGRGFDVNGYFAGYTIMLNEVNKVVVEALRKRPDRIAPALAAIDQSILIDMEIMVSCQVAWVEEKAAKERDRLAGQLESTVHTVIGELTRSGGTLRTEAQSMAGAADEASRQAANVANAAGAASSNVQTVAAAAEELSSAISEIARQVSTSSQIARKAADEARRTDVTVAGLSSAAAKIGEIVKLIATIAGQTNLLALNATIEAARAGEAGKGFAVVASEVKNLATQTAKATEDITGQVGAIQSATNETVAVMKGIGSTINEINEIATTIAAAVEEQGAATSEIARNVQQAASGTAAVTHTIDQVTRAASQTGSAAARVLQTSNEVISQSERLDRAVADFVRSIRAGG